MKNFKIDITNIDQWVSSDDLAKQFPAAKDSLEKLYKENGKGNDFLGWLELPEIALNQSNEIIETTREFRKNLDCIVVIGIGGSYLGTKSVLDALTPTFGINRPGPEILYAG